MTDSVERYPLSWPTDQPRTPPARRQWGPYKVSFAKARTDLLDELRRLGAKDIVISSDCKLRRDGLPYANERPSDPGVAVYWTREGRDFVVACDTYERVRSNLRAVGLTVHHLRRLEAAAPRFLADRAFQGFARLPAQAGPDGQRPWRDVLGYPPAYAPLLADLVARYRRRLREVHPDAGGSGRDAAEVNRAFADAKRQLGYDR